MAPGGMCCGGRRGSRRGSGAEARARRPLDDDDGEGPLTKWKRVRRWAHKNALLLWTMLGVVLGVLFGLFMRTQDVGPEAVELVMYPGELVMRILKLMILPLIIASLVSGAARLNASMNGKMAIRMLVYFVATSFLNAALGTVLVLMLRPGEGAPRPEGPTPEAARDVRILDSFLDLGRNVFADNLFQAAFQQAYTAYVPAAGASPGAAQTTLGPNTSGSSDVSMVRTLQYRDGTNTLGIIFFCLVFGTVLGQMGPKALAVLDFFTTLDEAIMNIVSGVMWLTPLGIGSVVSAKVMAVEDVALMVQMMGWFVFTVALGVIIYQLILMQLIYLAILRRNPYRFYWQLAPATVTAFATASTAAALPVTLRCMDREAGIDPRVSRFVLPIGCTINMDGTALFVAVASGFLVQLSGVSFSTTDAITLCLAATAASFSSASVPSAALVLIFMVLATLDAPQSDIPLLFAVDWFVDRVRTTNNMLGDCYAAAVVEWLSRHELAAADAAAGPGVASLANDASGPLLPLSDCVGCVGCVDCGADDDVERGDNAREPLSVVVHDTAADPTPTPPAPFTPRGLHAPVSPPAPAALSNGDARHA